MRAAGQQDELEQLLFTYRWLDAKLQATDIVSLNDDFDLRRDGEQHSQLGLLQHALQLSVSVLVREKDQLVSQLYSRLSGLGAEWEVLVGELKHQERVQWLRSKTPTLTAPGGNLVYTLRRHTDRASNLLLTPDGHLISSSHSEYGISKDFTVKVWDIDTGVLLHSLEAHTDGVTNLLISTTGHLITSCRGGDSTIASGTIIR